MRLRRLTLLAAIALGLGAPGPALAKADVNHILRLWAEGANFYADTCPLVDPVVDTPCTSYVVFYAREDSPNGTSSDPILPGGRVKAAFYAFAEIDDVIWHPDGTADATMRAFGEVPSGAIGTYDKTHLSFASVIASIPMSDGSMFDLNVVWAGGVVQKFGNSGPESQSDGFPTQRFHDACTTGVFNDHQKFAQADVSGTIGGIDITSFGYREAYIFNNWFHWTVVTHGNCTG